MRDEETCIYIYNCYSLRQQQQQQQQQQQGNRDTVNLKQSNWGLRIIFWLG